MTLFKVKKHCSKHLSYRSDCISCVCQGGRIMTSQPNPAGSSQAEPTCKKSLQHVENSEPDEWDAILQLIGFEPEFADTHGGCPPAYKGGHFTGKAELKAALQALSDRRTAAVLERLLQYHGAYIGMDGKRIDDMVHHSVIQAERDKLNQEGQ